MTDMPPTGVTMYETLVRQHDQITHSVPTIEDAIEKLREIEGKKKQRHDEQVASSRQVRAERLAKKQQEAEVEAAEANEGEGAPASLVRVKRKAEAMEAPSSAIATELNGSQVDAAREAELGEASALARMVVDAQAGPPEAFKTNEPDEIASRESSARPAKKVDRRENTTKPAPQARGHTSYLTFAVLLPLAAEGEANDGAGTASEANTSYAQIYEELASQDLAGLASGGGQSVVTAA